MKRSTKNAFTLIELLITVALLGTVVAFAVPAIADARQKAIIAQAQAVCNLLNGFAREIREIPASSPGTLSSSGNEAALQDYYDKGFLDRPISIKNVTFESGGLWVVVPP